MWRVTVFRDYLVLQELIFPDQITDTPEKVDFKVDAATTKLVGEFVENLMTSWDDLDTTDTMEERIEKWLVSGEIIERPEGESAPAIQGGAVDDLKASIKKAIKQSK
jgi:non-homologous end joining protein Ku